MCVVCGCSDEQQGEPHVDASTGNLHFGAGLAGVSVPGMSQARAIRLEADVLGENSRLAALNRAHFASHGVTAYDLVSSPGSGKTTLLCATIAALATRAPEIPLAVIEGDQQTSLDADRVRKSGAEAVQVNTGKGCHLDAQMVGAAFSRLHLHAASHGEHSHTSRAGIPGALLLIENVGNLVCPAMWDLGEKAKIVILSVTEGDDKPLKYPDMFASATLMVINKTDLLPYVEFSVDKCMENARRVNPTIEVRCVSATTGEGLEAWLDWLLHPTADVQAAGLFDSDSPHSHPVAFDDAAG